MWPTRPPTAAALQAALGLRQGAAHEGAEGQGRGCDNDPLHGCLLFDREPAVGRTATFLPGNASTVTNLWRCARNAYA
jgi:hypothetical protein